MQFNTHTNLLGLIPIRYTLFLRPKSVFQNNTNSPAKNFLSTAPLKGLDRIPKTIKLSLVCFILDDGFDPFIGRKPDCVSGYLELLCKGCLTRPRHTANQKECCH